MALNTECFIGVHVLRCLHYLLNGLLMGGPPTEGMLPCYFKQGYLCFIQVLDMNGLNNMSYAVSVIVG